MKKIIFDCGILPPSYAAEINKESKIDILFISNDVLLAESLRKSSDQLSVALYPNFLSDPDLSGCRYLDLDALTSFLIDDHQTFQLYDRTNRRILESTSIKIVRIMSSAAACYRFLLDKKPDYLLYGATPHHIDTWIFARTAEFLGIPVYYFQFSPIIWRNVLMRGLDRNTVPVEMKQELPKKQELTILKDYLALKSSSYSVARPRYITAQMKVGGEKSFFNLGRQLSIHYRRPDLILNNFICQKYYNNKAKQYRSGSFEKNIVFFMHYQPERTTLPDAFGYSQQLRALHQLIAATNGKCKLLVKEHPSTFLMDCRWKERNIYWYKKLASYPQVQFVPMQVDPYELIDACWFVATIAGSSGFEAILRQKPIVVFSPSSFQVLDHPKFHFYRDLHGLRNWIESIEKFQSNLFDPYRYLQALSKVSRTGLLEGDDLDNALTDYESRARYVSWKRMFLDFFNRASG